MNPATDQPTPALRAAKLKGLVERFCGPGSSPAKPGDGDPGVAVDGRAFFLADSVRSLGPALAWSKAQKATSVVVFAEDDYAGHLARRAGLLSGSIEAEVVAYSVNIYSPDAQLDLASAVACPVDEIPELPASHLAYIPVMAGAGARPTDDFGRLIAEVEGLEVARVTGAEANEDDTVLEVGVGLADRELQFATTGGADDPTRMAHVVAAVRKHRYPGAGSHPLSRIGRQRWLRSMLVEDPGLVDATLLASIPPLRASTTVLRQDPAAAYCEATNTLAVCQVGADLDLIPEALDLAARQDTSGDLRLVLVVPDRDRQLVSALVPSMASGDQVIEVLSPPPPWSTLR